jgi:ubiquinone/menaquinone biosynthesis C-methylase UbiE
MAKMSKFEALFVNSYFDYLLHKVTGMEKLIKIAVKHSPGRILEVGCGSGITTTILTERFPRSEIVAVDLDETQVLRAKKRLDHRNVQFVQGDATRLHYPDESFDTCFASYAFHHIPNFPTALREIHRVLQPSSHLYVLEIPFSKEIIRVLKKGRGHEQIDDQADVPDGFFTRKKLLREVGRAGFRVTVAKGLTHVYLGCERVSVPPK